MNKLVFKVLDDKGRVLIPQSLRQSIGVEKGDIISLAAEGGRMVARKAIVIDSDSVPGEARSCYVQAAVREFNARELTELLQLIARLIKESK